MCPQIVYSYKCKVTLTSQMDCLNRFKVLLSEPKYLTHLLLEGGDLGPRAPIAAKGLLGGDWGPGDPGPGAPIATWGPDQR